MCEGVPASVDEALARLREALAFLNAADAASLPSATQAQALRELERAESAHTAARARFLAAFAAQGGYEDDGQGSARAWLKWQTRVTSGAAAGAVGWARRLAAHPVIDHALATGELSCSWARHLCAWTGRLPEHARDGADQILCTAAQGGMELRGLAGLAEEIYHRTHPQQPSSDGDGGDGRDGFDDRYVRLGITFGGAGHTDGALTPGCATALRAVLDALGKKAGPEDTRTAAQRRHDALEEACRRLITADMVPDRAGQPTRLQVHMTLSQLRGLPGAGEAEAAWTAARAATHPGWLTGPEADAAVCDATITPVVTGHVDPAALDHLTDTFLAHAEASPAHAEASPGGHSGGRAGGPPAPRPPDGRTSGGEFPGEPLGEPPASGPAAASTTPSGPASPRPAAGGTSGARTDAATDGGGADAGGTGGGQRPAERPTGGSHPPEPLSGRAVHTGPAAVHTGPAAVHTGPAYWPLASATRQRLRRALLTLAADTLSGPGGLASHLRTSLTAPPSWPGRQTVAGPPATISLPLDVGEAAVTIPAHLRKAAGIRHRHCAFPGCHQPLSACDLHHLVPRSDGGPTSLRNLLPLCRFHHLVVIHRWGWSLTLHPDGTTTATSPGHTKTLHSHTPPGDTSTHSPPPSQAA